METSGKMISEILLRWVFSKNVRVPWFKHRKYPKPELVTSLKWEVREMRTYTDLSYTDGRVFRTPRDLLLMARRFAPREWSRRQICVRDSSVPVKRL